MGTKKFKIAWNNRIIARDMELNDALIFIRGLCNEYFNENIEITLLSDNIPEVPYNAE